MRMYMRSKKVARSRALKRSRARKRTYRRKTHRRKARSRKARSKRYSRKRRSRRKVGGMMEYLPAAAAAAAGMAAAAGVFYNCTFDRLKGAETKGAEDKGAIELTKKWENLAENLTTKLKTLCNLLYRRDPTKEQITEILLPAPVYSEPAPAASSPKTAAAAFPKTATAVAFPKTAAAEERAADSDDDSSGEEFGALYNTPGVMSETQTSERNNLLNLTAAEQRLAFAKAFQSLAQNEDLMVQVAVMELSFKALDTCLQYYDEGVDFRNLSAADLKHVDLQRANVIDLSHKLNPNEDGLNGFRVTLKILIPALKSMTERPESESPLRQLHLESNCLNTDDLKMLESLVQITVLNLCRNQIGDVGPLASLTNLTDLGLLDNPIKRDHPSVADLKAAIPELNVEIDT